MAAVVSFGGCVLARGESQAVGGGWTPAEVGLSTGSVHFVLARRLVPGLGKASASDGFVTERESAGGGGAYARVSNLQVHCVAVPIFTRVPRGLRGNAVHPGARMDYALVPMGASARLEALTHAMRHSGCAAPPADRFCVFGGFSQPFESRCLSWGTSEDEGAVPLLSFDIDSAGLVSDIAAEAGVHSETRIETADRDRDSDRDRDRDRDL